VPSPAEVRTAPLLPVRASRLDEFPSADAAGWRPPAGAAVGRHVHRALLARGGARRAARARRRRWDITGGDLDLVILVDASDSTRASQAAVTAWIDGAVAARVGSDRIAVAGVGRDAQVEHALRVDPSGGRLQSVSTAARPASPVASG
jgi:hypothetical protein